MEDRLHFILELEREEETSVASMSRRYGLSRKTIYKWLKRYREEGLSGLKDRSSVAKAPHGKVPLELEDAIVQLRREHAGWGPRKLRRLLERRSQLKLPAESTIALVLQRRGLIRPRRRHALVRRGGDCELSCDGPNALWCADLHGQLRLGDEARCHPLTLMDGFSRYLLRCRALAAETGEGVRIELAHAFSEYGMPERLRTSHRPPFGAQAPGGLSRNAIWLVQLGVRPEYVGPGHAEQSDREALHRTLKDATATPPRESLSEQQQAFDHFGREHNDVRPLEALGHVTPQHRYEPSPRTYTGKLREPEYDGAEVRRVSPTGAVSFRGRPTTVGRLLAGQPVAFRQVDDGVHEVHYGLVQLGYFVERDDQPGLRSKRPARAAEGVQGPSR